MIAKSGPATQSKAYHMPSFRHAFVLGLLCSIAALSACANAPTMSPTSAASAETIAISVGPCFGFCPVYKISVAPGGTIQFNGERHTAVLGGKTREAGSARYAEVARALAPYRPQRGTKVETTCDARISDQQHYQIV